jgi:hypothetical protein
MVARRRAPTKGRSVVGASLLATHGTGHRAQARFDVGASLLAIPGTGHRAQARFDVGASLLATGYPLATPDPAVVGIALQPNAVVTDGAAAAGGRCLPA